MSLLVNEIFYSIQGESVNSGRPCAFIRLTGCNLRCSYCDTTYAYQEGTQMEIEQLLAHVADYRCPLVEVTGGEDLFEAATALLADNRRAQLMGAQALLVFQSNRGAVERTLEVLEGFLKT